MYLRTGILLLALIIILCLLGMGYLISNAYFKSEDEPRLINGDTRIITNIPSTPISIMPEP